MGVMSRGKGINQWLFQRVSNAVFVVFGLFLVYVLASGLSYDSLHALVDNTLVKVYLVITLVFAFLNSILAGWQITGDYAKKFHISETLMMGVCVLVSAAYLLYGVYLIL
jgi:succinate dehydrogenase hydrophobic membrane anchor protein